MSDSGDKELDKQRELEAERAHYNPPDQDELEKIIASIRWGDFQREDGTWGYGVANRTEVLTAINKWNDGKVREALASLSLE